MVAPRMQSTKLEEEPTHSTRRWVFAVVILTLVAIVWSPLYAHMRAAAVLLRIQSSEARGFFANRGIHPIRSEEGTFESDGRKLRTRLYFPTDMENAPAMVVIHGVHHLGYGEPRLVRFAKAMSGAGLVVATPELPEIAGYEIKPQSIDEIAAAADDLAERMHAPCVGVLGLSFAGGLALEAASDPETSHHICYVVAIGAHDDMARVIKFFATNRAEYPDGSARPMRSHEYGMLVAIYAHPEEYFSGEDVPLARQAIRSQLFEELPAAKAYAAKLSPLGQATIAMLFSSDRAAASAALLQNLEKHRVEMDAVSPSSQLYRIHVPVLLLHGAGDNVIPPSETLWLAKDIPSNYVRTVLISPAISHVELGKDATLMDKWKLVHFVEQLLAEARNAPYNTADSSRLAGAATVTH